MWLEDANPPDPLVVLELRGPTRRPQARHDAGSREKSSEEALSRDRRHLRAPPG